MGTAVGGTITGVATGANVGDGAGATVFSKVVVGVGGADSMVAGTATVGGSLVGTFIWAAAFCPVLTAIAPVVDAAFIPLRVSATGCAAVAQAANTTPRPPIPANEKNPRRLRTLFRVVTRLPT